MAYHAGAELANIECFQINPLIKDYNGPACAYVTGPFGGYTANNRGHRFIECDYWSGQMMLEFWRELQSGNGPVFLKLDHLRRGDDHRDRAASCTPNERPSRGRFHERRGNNYRQRIRSRCTSRRSASARATAPRASGWTSTRETTVPGLYAAGDMASVPHNYMLGAFVNGGIAGAECGRLLRRGRFRRRTTRPTSRPSRSGCWRPRGREDGLTPHEMEFKTRRLVNDYLAAAEDHGEDADRPAALRGDARGPRRARGPRSARAACGRWRPQSILDCADMAAARLALPHREPLGPLPPAHRLPRDGRRRTGSATPCCYKDEQGRMAHRKRADRSLRRAVAADEMSAYHQLRIRTPVAAE